MHILTYTDMGSPVPLVVYASINLKYMSRQIIRPDGYLKLQWVGMQLGG